jgi:hypothetical protein
VPAGARIAVALAAGAVLAAGCGGAAEPSQGAQAGSAAKPAAAPPALCRGKVRVRITGHLSAPSATELSGLVVSPSRRDVLWSLNDSGNRPALLAVTTTGSTVAEVTVADAENVDWEDIAAGPAGSLLVGDIGDNLAQRPSIVVYRVPEQLGGGSVAPVARYELRYPDGGHDAEALLFDRSSATIAVVTKSFGGVSHVYVARRPSSRRPTRLRRTGTIDFGPGGAVTAGDVSADGRTIALRTYDRAFVWRRRAGESVAAALRRKPCTPRAGLIGEGQGEALALTRDGRAFYTVPEGVEPALRRYESSSRVS